MGTEFELGKMRRVLEMDGGDGLHGNVKGLNATERYT